ncbi:MAG: ATP-binding protein [Ruminococcus sp.]|nr:ATP-binding protein [Ruminococcus sp.]
MDANLKELDFGLNSLVIFRGILKERIVEALAQLLASGEEDTLTQIQLYSKFVYELYKKSENLTKYLLTTVLENENSYIIRHAEGEYVDNLIEECAEKELEVLQKIALLTPEDIAAHISYKGFLPKWKTSSVDFKEEYKKRIVGIHKYGYGLYSKYYMFIISDSKVVPVKYPDETKLSDLIGYKRERDAVIANTVALLEGRPAQNVLLCGDAGTGKSSTVKAVVNEFSDRGLRLIEITKEQLRDIPKIIDSISRNPLKFILFIDDLSFSSDDDCFGALKATLEGSVSARADNIAIYATSNRRHLVRENFSDRDGDDVHRNDTIQQLISLSARFGLTVTFTKPDKNAYMEIVNALAKQYAINMDENQLAVKAEAFALSGSGRSARTAKQFIYSLAAQNAEK